VAGPDEAGIPPGGLVFDRGAVSGAGGLDRWLAVVRAAEEPCLLVDGAGRVRAVSPAALRLLARTTDPVGRPLVPGLLDLVDVAALLGTTGNLAPIAAARSGIQARSLARFTPSCKTLRSRLSTDRMPADPTCRSRTRCVALPPLGWPCRRGS
jgi:hypothetical protein